VVLTVVERQPAAVVQAGEQSAVVDRTGRVLAVTPPAVDGLAVVEGVGLVEPGAVLDPRGQDLVRVAASLTPGLRSRVAVVRPAEGADDEIELVLTPDGVVRFGRAGAAAEIDEKVRTLATVFAEAQLDCLATVDVRVGDTAVLTRDPTCG
jgi:cell division septal protein FtsQ